MCEMKRVIGFGLAIVVNILFVSVFALPSASIPAGKVFVTELHNGSAVIVGSRER
jgi:hypothetical protein